MTSTVVKWPFHKDVTFKEVKGPVAKTQDFLKFPHPLVFIFHGEVGALLSARKKSETFRLIMVNWLNRWMP
jgi:hypothetical protein